jgi:hypothetical protein
MKKNPIKRFIVRKYVMATCAQEALKKERHYRPDDIWLDEEWAKNHHKDLGSAIGFTTTSERDYWS